jgi:hypothetical protein
MSVMHGIKPQAEKYNSEGRLDIFFVYDSVY